MTVWRPQRQAQLASQDHLDAQINFLLGYLPSRIDLAEEMIERKQKHLVLTKLTWGWGVVVGGLVDFWSNFNLNNRTLGNFGDINAWWGYGGVGFYAIGFGFPYIIGLNEDNLACHASDFLRTLREYRLGQGLDELFSSRLSIDSIKAVVGEFDAWVRIKLACITDFEGDVIEAAEVAYLLDELNAALNLRVGIEEAARSGSKKSDFESSSQDYDTNILDGLLDLNFQTSAAPESVV